MKLSVVIVAFNEEVNLGRTLESVRPLVCDGNGEIIVVDSGSTDRTVEVAKSFRAKVFLEEWKGYAAQKNSAIDKATGDWILSLDADEEVEHDLTVLISLVISEPPTHPQKELTAAINGVAISNADVGGYLVQRRNMFLGRWLRHGGFWPDPKLRLFRRGSGTFENRAVHEDVAFAAKTGRLLKGALLHHSYPTLSDYIDHMNRYSSLGAEMAVTRKQNDFGAIDIVFRPAATFIYNYIFRLGFLDGREGL